MRVDSNQRPVVFGDQLLCQTERIRHEKSAPARLGKDADDYLGVTDPISS